jgi:hypothetical protein
MGLGTSRMLSDFRAPALVAAGAGWLTCEEWAPGMKGPRLWCMAYFFLKWGSRWWASK